MFLRDPIRSERRLSRIWRAGALTALEWRSFISPFGPPPNYTNADWGVQERLKNGAWCRGYWWGDKNRERRNARNPAP